MYYLLYSLLFVLGVVIGSFLNVVALRYDPDRFVLDMEMLSGRSRCPICKKQLVWYELIPLFSFLFQRGRCRHCGHLISLQYPLVEFLSGLIFAAIPFYFDKLYNVGQLMLAGQNVQWFYGLTIAWVLVFITLLLLSVIDFRQLLIPNELNLFLGLLGIGAILFKRGSFLGFYAPILEFSSNVWVAHLFGAFIAALVFGAVIFLSRGKAMGLGDLKLAAALGFLFGWPDILLVVMLAFVIGSVLSIGLMLAKKKTLRDSLPFGPFLALSSLVVFLWGFQIVHAYFTLFGI